MHFIFINLSLVVSFVFYCILFCYCEHLREKLFADLSEAQILI